MSQVGRFAIAAIAVALVGMSSAEARARYPLTRCGPDLGYLCRIHGYFDQPPFHYNLAIYPGCIQTVAVETPSGVRRERAIVCGTPDRPMVRGWWW